MFCIAKNWKLRFSHLTWLSRSSVRTVTEVKKNVENCDFFTKLNESFICDENNGFVVPSFKKALLYPNNVAVKDMHGEFSYFQLYMTAKKLSIQISNICGSASLSNVAYLCSNSAILPMLQWGCWLSGQVIVPLINTYSADMLKHILYDARIRMIIATSDNENVAQELSQHFDVSLLIVDHGFMVPHHNDVAIIKKQILIGKEQRVLLAGTLTNDFYTHADAIILYSSAIYPTPIGVVISHQNLCTQLNSIKQAWNYNTNDSILNAVPQTYTHCYLKTLLCPLSTGAKVVMCENFSSHNVWKTILGINIPVKERVNVLIGSPSMYILLLSDYQKIFSKNSQMVDYIKNFCKTNFRLMVSGCGSIPDIVFTRWKEITGHRILEKYDKPECGIAISSPIYKQLNDHNESALSLHGWPLPGVKLRIVDKHNNTLFECEGTYSEGKWTMTKPMYMHVKSNMEQIHPNIVLDTAKISGKLEIGGPTVFKGYHNQSELTSDTLRDGFFKTGDEVIFENGLVKIIDKNLNDIINTGGYKVYCLEIESILRSHPCIKEVAVVGVPDSDWVERVGAVCVLYPESNLDIKSVQSFCAQTLPSYKHPSMLKIVKEIPRNDLSKIDRKQLFSLFNE